MFILLLPPLPQECRGGSTATRELSCRMSAMLHHRSYLHFAATFFDHQTVDTDLLLAYSGWYIDDPTLQFTARNTAVWFLNFRSLELPRKLFCTGVFGCLAVCTRVTQSARNARWLSCLPPLWYYVTYLFWQAQKISTSLCLTKPVLIVSFLFSMMLSSNNYTLKLVGIAFFQVSVHSKPVSCIF